MNTTTYARAKEITGELCVDPDTILKNSQQIQEKGTRKDWSTVPFSEEVLESVRDSYVLIAGFPLNIREMDQLFPDLFIEGYKDRARRFKFTNEPFAVKERVEERWYLLRIDPVPESFYSEYISPTDLSLSKAHGKTLEEQSLLLKPNERIPKACEVVYLAALCKALWGLPYFYYYVRTADSFADGAARCSYVVGYHDRWGLDIDFEADDDPRHRIGLASEIVPSVEQ